MPPAKTRTRGKKEPKHAQQPAVRNLWRICAGIAAVVFILYWRLTANLFVTFDDGDYITLNEHVKHGFTSEGVRWAFGEASNGNWHPLTWLTHMADVEFFGLNPAAHHLVSVFWHAATAVILLLALFRMTGYLWRSAFVAGLFALHPLRVESVAWAAERKDVLGGFFYICTLWAYGWYAERPQDKRRYLAVAGLLALGLMSKPSVVTAPCVLLLLDYWPLARKERPLQLVLEKLPLFGLTAVISLVTFAAQKQVGAMTAIQNLAFPAKIANATVSYVRYLGKIFWPHPLAVLYPFQRNLSALEVGGCLLLLAAITVLAVLQRKQRPYLPVGWLWYVGTLVPMIGIVQVGWQSYADRYTYIPCIGIFIAIVWLVAETAERAQLVRPAVWAGASVLAVLAAVTWTQLPYWHDDITLFQHAIDVTAGNPAGRYHLAGDLIDAGRPAEAKPHLQEAIRLQPDFYATYYQLGKINAEEGNIESATRNFSQSIRLNPGYGEAHYAQAMMLMKSGQPQAAEPEFRSAIQHQLSPEFTASAHDALGVIHAQRGEMQQAVEEFGQAVRIKPDLASTQLNLAHALVSQGRISEAVARLQFAVTATHGDANVQRLLADLRGRS